jgi:hypothetical protein
MLQMNKLWNFAESNKIAEVARRATSAKSFATTLNRLTFDPNRFIF